MCLFDPVLAVLSATSGRISFRDIYADAGSGLGQVSCSGVQDGTIRFDSASSIVQDSDIFS